MADHDGYGLSSTAETRGCKTKRVRRRAVHRWHENQYCDSGLSGRRSLAKGNYETFSTANRTGCSRRDSLCERNAAMTHEELIKEIKQLPVEERIAVMDAISQSVEEETQSRATRISVVDQLYGIAKHYGPMPSVEGLKEDYIRYLTEKYS